MKPERWEQIDRLLQLALQRPQEERKAFLIQACGGDEALRREIESLLAAHGQAGSFLETQAVKVEARALASGRSQPGAGGVIGPYRILDSIGSGGMGEVYRARDTRLAREVAIKVLPNQFIQDKERLSRFTREAQAASALNHPNIITIYEIGHSDGTHFIATELIEGETLRQRITSKGMRLSSALDLVVQVASALVAAHAAGIVHRDIKPENIMVRPDGVVKVLDFGLAKLNQQLSPTAHSGTPTALDGKTDPGTVLGTVRYMSPEQARGLTVDVRTDIFSLGVVLYEMIAGCTPFAGASAAEVFVSILEKEPLMLGRFVSGTPDELERIVSKALAKDREERYQNGKDLLIDLKRLKQRLEYEHYRDREGAEALSTRSAVTMKDGAAIEGSSGQTSTIQHESATTVAAGAVSTTSSAEIIISEIKRHKRGALLGLAALVVVISGVAFGLYKWIGYNQSRSRGPFQELKLTPLTTNGKAIVADISPDGKHVVYAMNEEGKQSLWLRQMAISSTGPIVPAAEVRYDNLIFSPDGNFLYYHIFARDNPELTGLYQMTYLGRNPRRLMAGGVGMALSRDGKRLAIVRRNPQAGGESVLTVSDLDGSNERTLIMRKSPDSFGLGAPLAWSPDGKTIACGAGRVGAGGYNTLVAVGVEGGAEKPINAHRWDRIDSVAWPADGSGLILAALDRALGPSAQLWQISYPGGKERKLTNDLNDYRTVSLTADSGRLLTLQESLSLSLWILPQGESSRATQITSRTGKTDGQGGIAWTPDGRIVYTSTASGNLDLWIMNADGSDQKQLTMNAGRNYLPAVSPDGRYVVFGSDRTDRPGIWRMNLDGSGQKQLSSDGGTYPQCSPDGKWVVYHGPNPTRLWRVPMEGGTPAQLIDQISHYPAISPDGKFIAHFSVGGRPKIAVMTFEGGPPIKTFDLPGIMGLLPGLRWTPDGRALTYVYYTNATANIWRQPFDGGSPKQLTEFKEEQIYRFDWSRDGRLVVSRGVTNRDVVLISGSK